MPPNVHYVSVLVYNITDPYQTEQRLEWLKGLLEARLPLTLFIDMDYHERLISTWWFQVGDHPELRMIPWSLEESETWARCVAASPNRSLTLPEERNRGKDTEFFMALMNAKMELVARVAEEVGEPFVAFLDAGIGKIFRDPVGSLGRLKNLEIREDFSGVLVPGCWQPGPVALEDLSQKICWMYCGGFFLVPRLEAAATAAAGARALRAFLEEGRITWEVNVWVHMTSMEGSPAMHWFAADHNDRIIKIPESFFIP